MGNAQRVDLSFLRVSWGKSLPLWPWYILQYLFGPVGIIMTLGHHRAWLRCLWGGASQPMARAKGKSGVTLMAAFPGLADRAIGAWHPGEGHARIQRLVCLPRRSHVVSPSGQQGWLGSHLLGVSPRARNLTTLGLGCPIYKMG